MAGIISNVVAIFRLFYFFNAHHIGFTYQFPAQQFSAIQVKPDTLPPHYSSVKLRNPLRRTSSTRHPHHRHRQKPTQPADCFGLTTRKALDDSQRASGISHV
jgi:hypothetical protein